VERFGEAYRKYQKEAPQLIPRLRRKTTIVAALFAAGLARAAPLAAQTAANRLPLVWVLTTGGTTPAGRDVSPKCW